MAKQSVPPILLTRPLAAGQAFAEAVRAALGPDWPLVAAPLQAIVFRPEAGALRAALAAVPVLLFTSQAGVAAFQAARGGDMPPGLRAWAVGPQTAAAAEAAGLKVQSAGGDAAGLAAALLAAGEAGPFLHLRGAHQRGDLVGQLAAAGLPAKALVLYDQSPCPLSPEAAALLAAPGLVLAPLFSPRSAALLAAVRPEGGADLHLLALSPAVAAEFPLRPGDRCTLAASPDGEGMIAALKALSLALA